MKGKILRAAIILSSLALAMMTQGGPESCQGQITIGDQVNLEEGCINAGFECDASLPCCGGDCVDGICTQAVCGDGVKQGEERCDVAIPAGEDGACPSDCDDQNDCTKDALESSGTCMALCRHEVEAAGKACDDGDACTQTDTCAEEGVCVGSNPRDCDDGDICTTDHSCDPQTGECTFKTVICYGAACAETACNKDISGGCVGGSINCDDGNPCTNDFCNSVSGLCMNIPNMNSCNDGDGCTVNDKCSGGSCTAGTPKVCNPLGECYNVNCINFFGIGRCVQSLKANGGSCNYSPGLTGECLNGICIYID